MSRIRLKDSARMRGFSLIELLVVIAIIGLMAIVALPAISDSITSAKTASLAHAFPQDVSWAHNYAASSLRPVQIVVGPDNCAWTARIGTYQNDGSISWNAKQADIDLTLPHSMQDAGTRFPGAMCTVSGNGTQTLTFDSRGMITGATPQITVKATNGQEWNMQVLMSGTVLTSTKTSS